MHPCAEVIFQRIEGRFQLVHKGFNGRVAIFNRLGKRPLEGRVKRAGQVGAYITGRFSLFIHMLLHQRERVRGGEGQLPGEQRIGHHCRRVLVRGGVCVLTAPLFRGHIRRRTERGPGAGQLAGRFGQLGDTEIHDERIAMRIKHHVARLNIAVNNPLAVGIVQCPGNLR